MTRILLHTGDLVETTEPTTAAGLIRGLVDVPAGQRGIIEDIDAACADIWTGHDLLLVPVRFIRPARRI